VENVTAQQEELIARLQARDPELFVDWDEHRGLARVIRGNLASEGTGADEEAQPILEAFLEGYGALVTSSDSNSGLALLRRQSDELGWTHLEYQQTYRVSVPGAKAGARRRALAVEVYGSKLVGHVTAQGQLIEVQSSCWREITLEDAPRVLEADLQRILTEAAVQIPGFASVRAEMQKVKEEQFPVMQRPRLAIYPWQNSFRHAWTTFAYGPQEVPDATGLPSRATKLDLGEAFVDAVSGEVFLFLPTRKYVDNPDVGTGLAVTPLGGPFTVRNMNIIRVDSTSTYRLRDTTHARDVFTYDAACSSSWSTKAEIATAITGGTLPVSSDTEGDKNWNTLAADTTTAQRTAGQQAEVDAHFFCGRLYEWHDALQGGRAGWDNGAYSDPPVPPGQPVRMLVHVYDDYPPPGLSNCRSVNAYFDRALIGGRWIPFLAFFDCDPTLTCTAAADRAVDYLAGSKAVVGHEYQHAITDYSFVDGAGNPGLPYPTAPNPEWLSAVHEGLSDVFGCLFAEDFLPVRDVSSAGLYFRNLVYPRDPNAWENRTGGFPCGLGASDMDHFADRNTLNFRYSRGTILAHCAYLMGQGGVHQRSTRLPVLIPSYSLGRETVGGLDVLKAARVWHRALRLYLGNIGTATGIPTNDENVFRTIRNGCVSAASDLYGNGTMEHKTTILAFYAVGLHPAGTNYGADVTFLRWGADWWRSRPFIGIPSPDWSSMDLFINNGGMSEWNALINVVDAMGNPTQFENTVYCRVRNVGDQPANDTQVSFYYAKLGTGVLSWLPVTDKNGVVQTLSIGTLAAGVSNFLDSQQNSPPASASIKWYIPPLAPGETVDHFCLKAVVSASNDVNPHNNETQSNIAYAAYTPAGFRASFLAGNPTEKEIAVELVVDSSLPEGWKVRVPRTQVTLQPRQEELMEIVIDMLDGSDKQLQPPFDGDLTGHVFGSLSGPITGTLSETSWDGSVLKGRVTVHLDDLGTLHGRFEGRVNLLTAEAKGRVDGEFSCLGNEKAHSACVALEACLRPWRRVNVRQLVGDHPIGGLTVQVQLPIPPGRCGIAFPPTGTRVGGGETVT
jgi:hypothetical protein